MFYRSNKFSREEINGRAGLRERLLTFGNKYLDDALDGILPNDLVLLGSSSGVGKTQMCVNIAYANIRKSKKVHLIALESSKYEIERRIKFKIISDLFYQSNYSRPKLNGDLNFRSWLLGDHLFEMSELEEKACEIFESEYSNLFLFNKGEKFGINELVEAVVSVSEETDLIIIDHVHYFDIGENENENKFMKEVAKTCMNLASEEKKPILLVAHLRKRDRGNTELCPGMEEFHGSSDLFKISTKVITIAPGGRTSDGLYETYFRASKNRIDSGPSRFIGRMFFDPKLGGYENGYSVGSANQTREKGFAALGGDYLPDWAKPKG